MTRDNTPQAEPGAHAAENLKLSGNLPGDLALSRCLQAHCVLAAAASCAAGPCAHSPPEVRARGGFPGEDPSGCRAAPSPDACAAAGWGGASCGAPLPAPASAAWPIMLAAAGAEAGPWLGRLHPYWRTMVVACCRVVCSRAVSVRSLAERARPLSEAPGMHTWAGSDRGTQSAVATVAPAPPSAAGP